jgi:hypothetical protein
MLEILRFIPSRAKQAHKQQTQRILKTEIDKFKFVEKSSNTQQEPENFERLVTGEFAAANSYRQG